MGYCSIGTLLPAMDTDSGKLSRKIALLDPDSSMAAKDKRCFQYSLWFSRGGVDAAATMSDACSGDTKSVLLGGRKAATEGADALCTE